MFPKFFGSRRMSFLFTDWSLSERRYLIAKLVNFSEITAINQSEILSAECWLIGGFRGRISTKWDHDNCVASGATILWSGKRLANWIILRKFRVENSAPPYSRCNCVDTGDTICLPYSARWFPRISLLLFSVYLQTHSKKQYQQEKNYQGERQILI